MDTMKLVYLLQKKLEKEALSMKSELTEKTWGDFQESAEGKKLVLFGTGELFEYFMEVFSHKYSIAYAVDNHLSVPEKRGVKIYDPSILSKEGKNYIVLIMTINQIDRIYEQLQYLDCKMDVFSFPILEYNRKEIRQKVDRALNDGEYALLLKLKVDVKRAEDRIECLEKRCQGLLEKCQGLQERQTKRYLYLLHTNRIVNALIDKTEDVELKKEQMRYLFSEIFENEYEPNLETPRTYNEKMLYMTLYDHNPLYTRITDKLQFKDYVAKHVGEEYVVPLLGVWNSAEEIEWDKLPSKFVLKSNAGGDSQKVILIKDKAKEDLKELSGRIKTWEYPYSNDYFYNFNWPFKNISFRIIAEEYLPIDNLPYYDFKVHCFHGEPRYIHVVGHEPHEVTYYDLEWNKVPLQRGYPNIHYEIPRPARLQDMIDISRKLSKEFTYIRVDFYCFEDNLFVGELTMTSFGALIPFHPKEEDYRWGEQM